jgi:hypothetical protein
MASKGGKNQPREAKAEGGKNQPREAKVRGGKKSGTKAAELGLGIHGRSAEQCTEDSSKGAKTTNSQKWKDPDHPELGEHSAPTLAQMQKRRGYPHAKENRVRVK